MSLDSYSDEHSEKRETLRDICKTKEWPKWELLKNNHWVIQNYHFPDSESSQQETKPSCEEWLYGAIVDHSRLGSFKLTDSMFRLDAEVVMK